MITRRSFLSALCALPIVGKWIAQNRIVHLPDRYAVVRPDFAVRIHAEDRECPQLSNDKLYDPWHETVVMERNARGLPVAEWDRRYQA